MLNCPPAFAKRRPAGHAVQHLEPLPVAGGPPRGPGTWLWFHPPALPPLLLTLGRVVPPAGAVLSRPLLLDDDIDDAIADPQAATTWRWSGPAVSGHNLPFNDALGLGSLSATAP